MKNRYLKSTTSILMLFLGLIVQSSAQIVQGDQTDTLHIDESTIVVHQYTEPGASTFTPPPGVTEVTYLVIAGGGGAGGGDDNAVKGTGGGGAGGLLTGALSDMIPDSAYSVSVGGGGIGGLGTGNASPTGENGENSIFSSIVALGGGGGGTAGQIGQSGGSGGGAGGRDGKIGGVGTFGQGHAGGNSTTATVLGRAAGGGGGGSGEAGFNGAASGSSPTFAGFGGNGGNGYISSITGSANAYAAGGAGGGVYAGGTGGYGGGGDGRAVSGVDGVNGVSNTGSGGGGIARNAAGGNGGSGIVVIRYEMPDCETSYSTLNEVVCDSLALNGTVYTTSGEFTQTLVKENGCDSIITLNLQVNNSYDLELNETACESFTYDDQTYFESGLYEFNYTTQFGCDSTITIDLTILDKTASTLSIEACNSYLAPDGQEYGESGEYIAVVPNAAGCDSTITIDLTINADIEVSISAEACGSYTAPDETVYTTSGQYLSVLSRSNGCDSLVTVDLTILDATSSTISAEACNVYTAPDGQEYTSSGQYVATISNSAGCDSVITINLTMVNSTLQATSTTETANIGYANGSATVIASGGTAPYTYQWNDPFMTTTATLVGVFPGFYTCLITDDAGCTIAVEVFVPVFTDVLPTRLNDQHCNQSGYELHDYVSAVSVDNAQAYRWQFTEQGEGSVHTYTRNQANPHLRLSWVTGLEIGKTYEVRVKAMADAEWADEYGDMCTLTLTGVVPQTELMSGYYPTNNQGNNYSLCDFALAYTVSNATNMRWRFDPDTDPGNGNEIYYTRGTGNPSVRLSWVSGIQPNVTYNVAVEAQVSGSWSGFGNEHAIVLADVSDQVALRADNCSKTYSPTGIIQSESVCKADFYRFRFTPQGPGSVRQKTVGSYTLLLGTMNPPLEPGTYDVQVQMQQNGVIGAYGSVCPITISGPEAFQESGLPSMRSTESDMALGLFPNPNSGSAVTLIAEGLPESDHTIHLTLFDGVGKMVTQDQIVNNGSRLSHIFDVQNLQPGIYLVQVAVQGTHLATERLIIQ